MSFQSDTKAYLVLKTVAMSALICSFSWWHFILPEEIHFHGDQWPRRIINLVGPLFFFALWIPNLAGASLYHRWGKLSKRLLAKHTFFLGLGLLLASLVVYWINNQTTSYFLSFALAIFSSFYLVTSFLLIFIPPIYFFIPIISAVDLGFIPIQIQDQIGEFLGIGPVGVMFLFGHSTQWAMFPWLAAFLLGIWTYCIFEKFFEKSKRRNLYVILVYSIAFLLLLTQENLSFFQGLDFSKRPQLNLEIFIVVQLFYLGSFFFLSNYLRKQDFKLPPCLVAFDLGIFPCFCILLAIDNSLKQFLLPQPLFVRLFIVPIVIIFFSIMIGEAMKKLRKKVLVLKLKRSSNR